MTTRTPAEAAYLEAVFDQLITPLVHRFCEHTGIPVGSKHIQTLTLGADLESALHCQRMMTELAMRGCVAHVYTLEAEGGTYPVVIASGPGDILREITADCRAALPMETLYEMPDPVSPAGGVR